MLRVEPEIKTNYVANGLVSLAFSHVLDHGNASRTAHQAAECAGIQKPEAFWTMHDLLFNRQAQLWNTTPELLTGWATELGLEESAFTSCLNDAVVAEKVTQIDQARRDKGVRIRPSFDINGRLIEGALPYERFTQLFTELGITE